MKNSKKKAKFKIYQVVRVPWDGEIMYDQIRNKHWASQPATGKPRWRYEVLDGWYDESGIRPLTKKEKGDA